MFSLRALVQCTALVKLPLLLIPPHSDSIKEREGESVRTRGKEHQVTLSPAPVRSQQLWRPAQDSAGSRLEREGTMQPRPLTEKRLTIPNCWERESHFSSGYNRHW